MNKREMLNWYDLIGGKNMDIINIEIEGFKNINKVFLSLSNITALVGLNNYGKSNLMEAIDFAINFIKNNKDKKRKMMAWSNGIPINKNIVLKDFLIDFELKSEINNKEYFINYGFKFAWIKKDDTGSQILSEWLKIKLSGKGQKYNSVILRDNGKAYYKSSETGRCDNIIKIDKDELVINKLQAFDNLYYNDIINIINTINIYIDHHLDVNSSYMPDPLIRKGFNELDVDGIDNIPRVIYFLKKEYENKYNLLENAFMQLFPNIIKIAVEEFETNSKIEEFNIDEETPFLISNNIYAMSVIDKNLNQPINFEKLSDGTKRVFLMLTYAIIADIKNLSLIAFEEPENSIHPGLLQSYLRILSQLVNKCKIMLASHSPYIIQYMEPVNIYIGVPNQMGIADFHKIAKSKSLQLLNDASDSDNSIGDYIFDLMSSDEEDNNQLVSYLENDHAK